MVYRIYVEPDSGHPYDPHTKTSVYSKPCICTTVADDIYRNRSADDHSIYYIWQNVGICGTADGIFCVSDSVHPALYGAGNKFEKSICASLWRIAVKGGMKDELDKSLDKIIWNNEVYGTRYGILGIDCSCDRGCDPYECNILEYGADRKIKDKIFPSKIRK